MIVRGGPRNSLGGGGFWVGILQGRVRVHGNFHILTSKKKNNSEGGGLNPLPPLDPPLMVLGHTRMEIGKMKQSLKKHV